MTDISPHAVVACPANLAAGVTVGAFTYIGPKVRIGAGTRVDNNVVIDGDVEIGPDNHIYPFAVIGADAAGRIRIGRGNQIREHVVVCAAEPPDEPTRVGDFTLLSTGSYVGASSRIEDRVVLGTYSQLAENTHLEEHVWTSAFTGTQRDVRIGRYSFTSGYAGIDHDAPPFAMLQGFPFRIRGVNTHNLKRCGFSEQAIEALKEIFRALFNGAEHGGITDRLAEWSGRTDLDDNQRYLVDFLHRAGYEGAGGPNGGKGAG